MRHLDLKKALKPLYLPSAGNCTLVDVPAMNFVMLDGSIEPGRSPGTSPLFQESMQALYAAAFTEQPPRCPPIHRWGGKAAGFPDLLG